MNYKLRNAIQPKNVETCLEDILTLRGVEDIDSFLNPTKDCELNPLILITLKPVQKCYQSI